jgi:hypothetical protein
MPGSWQKVAGGWQWTPGFWAEPTQIDEAEYLPTPPPQSLDSGPSIPAPTADSTYVPGCWVFQVNRFLWRPGYWVRYQPGWVWTPSCWRWTRAGYLYCRGFWDRPLHLRGLLFAPCRFARVVLTRTFVYRPAHCVEPDFLLGALFVRPRYCHYFFGDFFEPVYVKRGFVPWVDYHVRKGIYDANYSYYRHAYARYPAWDRGLRQLYTARFEGTVPRPPRTLAQQTHLVNTLVVKKTGNAAVHTNIQLTHLQNVTALAPVRKATAVRVTGLSTLAGLKPAEVKNAPVHATLKVERVSKQPEGGRPLPGDRPRAERGRGETGCGPHDQTTHAADQTAGAGNQTTGAAGSSAHQVPGRQGPSAPGAHAAHGAHAPAAEDDQPAAAQTRAAAEEGEGQGQGQGEGQG